MNVDAISVLNWRNYEVFILMSVFLFISCLSKISTAQSIKIIKVINEVKTGNQGDCIATNQIE